MAMDRDDLDDTYDLLSPVRRSDSYSDKFESSLTDDKTSDTFHTSSETATPRFKSPSFSFSSKIHPPKYASTSRHQGKVSNDASTFPRQRPKKQVFRHTSPVKERGFRDSTKDLIKMPDEDGNSELSVWEDWLIRKLQEEREQLKLKKISERQAKQEQERIEREKEEKKRQAEINRQLWCEQKLLKAKLQRKIQHQEKILKEELKAQEREQIKVKAREAYQKWMEKQKQIEHERKQKEEQKKLQIQKEQEEKKRKNEECFQNWLRKANERKPPSPRPKSRAPNEYPDPTFRNPVAWVGPMSDKETRESVRRQHKNVIAEKHESLRSRTLPQTGNQRCRGLISTGPEKGKGVLICRPATAAPIFYNVPLRNNKKFAPEIRRPYKGRS